MSLLRGPALALPPSAEREVYYWVRNNASCLIKLPKQPSYHKSIQDKLAGTPGTPETGVLSVVYWKVCLYLCLIKVDTIRPLVRQFSSTEPSVLQHAGLRSPHQFFWYGHKITNFDQHFRTFPGFYPSWGCIFSRKKKS